VNACWEITEQPNGSMMALSMSGVVKEWSVIAAICMDGLPACV
jgi:hypothetical protein